MAISGLGHSVQVQRQTRHGLFSIKRSGTRLRLAIIITVQHKSGYFLLSKLFNCRLDQFSWSIGIIAALYFCSVQITVTIGISAKGVGVVNFYFFIIA